MTPALSFVVPLYNSAATIASLVHDIERLTIEGGHELVLVNDGSADETAAICRALVARLADPHHLRRTRPQLRRAQRGADRLAARSRRHVVNLDDDGQNPPDEAVRLWRHAVADDLDVVFGHYDVKQHSLWRNAGSWFTNRMTDWALDKPPGFYLSSFRCVSRLVATNVSGYTGPYPYLDGLLLQVTQRIGSITVRHDDRRAGQSGYTLRRLLRLWLSAWLNFSLLPLRAATCVGLVTAIAGLAAFAVVVQLWASDSGPAYGWGWVMATVLVFSGTQLVMLGLIGEYVGRMFLTVNQRPQAVVREVVSGGGPEGS